MMQKKEAYHHGACESLRGTLDWSPELHRQRKVQVNPPWKSPRSMSYNPGAAQASWSLRQTQSLDRITNRNVLIQLTLN